MKKILFAVLILILISIGIYYFYQKSSLQKDVVVPTIDEPINQIANPASVNCEKVGGNLIIEKRGDGGEYGLCYFEDNRACEEWALLRGDCPWGGMKTTGYITIDQKYCAWSGGQTFSVPDSICIFKNGSKCSTIDFYNGKCETKTPPINPVACTMEAKLCPDGSAVGRTGPNCEFTPCP